MIFKGATELWETIDLASLHAIVQQIRRLESEGWLRTESHGTIQLKLRDAKSVSVQIGAAEILENSIIGLRIVGRIEGSILEIRRVGTGLEITTLPEIDLNELFYEKEAVELANRAWNRDVDAALQLPLKWDIEVDIRLEKIIQTANLEVQVSIGSTSLLEEFAQLDLDSVAVVFPRHGKRRIFVCVEAPYECLHLGSVSFVGTATGSSSTGLVESIEVPENVYRLGGEAGLDISPVPSELLEIGAQDPGNYWDSIRQRCEVVAGILAWKMIASDVFEENGKVFVDIRGLKRTRFELPNPNSYSLEDAKAVYRLYSWTFYDKSPDRLLATRQVVSLYSDSDAIKYSADILESAQVVYAGLRNDSVAEALRNVREAESRALDTVRASVRSVQDLAKSATERLLASLVAVGGVVVADDTHSVSIHTGRLLLLIIVAFIGFLALVAAVIEGPLLSLPFDKLGADLEGVISPMSEEQRRRIITLPSVEATKRQVLILRIFIPSVYVVTIVLVVLFAFPNGSGI